MAEEPSLSYYLPIAGGRIIGFIPFPRVLVLCEMQSVSSRIWTRIAVFISYGDNDYTTGTSIHDTQFFYKLSTSSSSSKTNLMQKNPATVLNYREVFFNFWTSLISFIHTWSSCDQTNLAWSHLTINQVFSFKHGFSWTTSSKTCLRKASCDCLCLYIQPCCHYIIDNALCRYMWILWDIYIIILSILAEINHFPISTQFILNTRALL